MYDLRFLSAVLAATLALVAGSAARAQDEAGLATVYAAELEGQLTASGQPYDPARLTAAHRTLPLGTRLRVIDPASGRIVVVVVNDRWGGGPGRVINLSRRAADRLGMGTELKVELAVEEVGTGRVEAAPDAGGRERLPARIQPASQGPGGRAAQCQNEAAILGLKDQWAETHVRNCLARKVPR